MSVNIGQLKKQLQNLGISTNTPGLLGDDRYEELRNRLDEASITVSHHGLTNSGTSSENTQETSLMMPSLNHLSIGEIRSRLTALGESTATPNMTGDERRNELLKRLINSICGTGNDEPVQETMLQELTQDIVVTVPSLEPPAHTSAPVLPSEPEIVVPNVSLEDISELKKELKRLINKRAIHVATKLSGNNQDTQLKACEAKVNRVDGEIAQLKTLKSRAAEAKPSGAPPQFRSEFISPQHTYNQSPDSLIATLEAVRAEAKDQIREHRLRIRDEGDSHPEFGVAAEEKVKLLLSNANLASSKQKQQSRTRSKISESIEIENKLSSSNSNMNISDSGNNATGLATSAVNTSKTVTVGVGKVSSSSVKETISPNENSDTAVSSSSSSKQTESKLPDYKPSAAATAAIKGIVLHKSKSEVTSSSSPDKIDNTTNSNDSSSGARKQLLLVKSPPKSSASFSIPDTTAAGYNHNEHTTASTEQQKKHSSSSNALLHSTASAASTASSFHTENRQNKKPSAAQPQQRQDADEIDEKEDLVGDEQTHSLVSSAAVHSNIFFRPAGEPPLSLEKQSHNNSNISPTHSSIKLPQVSPTSKPSAKPSPPSKSAATNNHIHSSHNSNRNDDTHHSKSTSKHHEQQHSQAQAKEHKTNVQRGEMQSKTVSEEKHQSEHSQQLSNSSVPHSKQHPLAKHSSKTEPLAADNDGESDEEQEEETTFGERLSVHSDSDGETAQQIRLLRERGRQAPKATQQAPQLQTQQKAQAKSDSPPKHRTLAEHHEHNSSSHSMHSISSGSSHNLSQHNVNKHGSSFHRAHPPPPSGPPPNQKSQQNIPIISDDASAAADGDDDLVELTKDDHSDSENDGEEDSEEKENNIQIKILREHARTLQQMNDIPASEVCLERALALDPTNITTLQIFALFLHTKKGELVRAEAFFNRGLQICLPGVKLNVMNSARGPAANKLSPHNKDKPSEREGFSTNESPQVSPKNLNTNTASANIPLTAPPSGPTGMKVKHIVRFILSYAHFLTKASGDIDAAAVLYAKALELAPESSLVLSTYAHFLAKESTFSSGPDSVQSKNYSEQAVHLFQQALLVDPGNATISMWYAKLLKKLGRTGQAELMYSVALEKSRGNLKLEPTAICNYATFLFKIRRDPARAQQLFAEGLERFPDHKGLVKNYCTLLRVHTHLGSADEIKRKNPKAGNTQERVERILTATAAAEQQGGELLFEETMTRVSTALSQSRQNTASGSPNRMRNIGSPLKSMVPAQDFMQIEDDDEEDDETSLRNNPFIKRLKGTPSITKKITNIATVNHSYSNNSINTSAGSSDKSDTADKPHNAHHDISAASHTTNNNNSSNTVSSTHTNKTKKVNQTIDTNPDHLSNHPHSQQSQSSLQNAQPNARSTSDKNLSPDEILAPWADNDGHNFFFEKNMASSDCGDEEADKVRSIKIRFHNNNNGNNNSHTKSAHRLRSEQQQRGAAGAAGLTSGVDNTGSGALSKLNSFTATLSPTESFRGVKYTETDD